MFTITGSTVQGMSMVPDIFINTYMKDANIAQVKVYLCLLYMEKEKQGTDISEIADKYNFTERDVVRSLLWLEERGLIKLFIKDKKLESVTIIKQADAPMVPVPRKIEDPAAAKAPMTVNEPAKENPIPPDRPEIPSRGNAQEAPGETKEASLKKEADQDGKELPEPRKLTPSELAGFLSKEENSSLIFIIEQYMGKPLTPADISEICYMSRELHFSSDLIDYLVQYAVDRGRKRMSYIRGIAQKWAVYGIMTVPQAKEKGEEAEAAGKKKPGRKFSGTGKQQEAPVPEEHWEGEGSYIENHQQKVTRPNSRNTFNNFEQNVYDFDALERELLGE